jgi:hypothetical protein
MAVFEHASPNIYTDSETTMNDFTTEPGNDTCSEGSASAMMIGSSTSTRNMSPSKGTRRSTRLSKGRGGDLSGHSSDDSDPHIDVGDVLMHEEDRLLSDEERKADCRHRIEKQILAVALVKSVVKKEDLPDGFGNTHSQVAHEGEIESSTQPLSDSLDSSSGDASDVCMSAEKRRKGNEHEVDEQPLVSPAGCEDSVGVKNEVKSENNEVENNDVTSIPVTPAQTADNESPETTASGDTVVTRANTRAKARGAKTRNVGLKAEYASIRETPRFAPKPSLPVPNPLLSLPSAGIHKDAVLATPKQQMTRAKVKSKQAEALSRKRPASDPTPAGAVTSTQPQAAPPAAPLPTNTLSFMQVKKEEKSPTADIISSALTPLKSNETGVNDSDALTSRRRIFSIDLDREYLMF